jgi:hypothetical protein
MWAQVTSPTGDILYSIDMITPTDGWVVGFNGTILHWDGASWTLTPSPISADLFSVDMLSATDGWAVGTMYENFSMTSKILHWNGTIWSEVTPPPSATGILNSISMISSMEGWTVGWRGEIFYWNGSEWTEFSSPTTSSLNAVQMISSTDGWIVTSRSGIEAPIWHWIGYGWLLSANPSQYSLYDITMLTNTEGWAVGQNGVILYYVPPTLLTINYNIGAPGSFFTLIGSNFPSDTTINILVNNNSLGTIDTDASGNFTCLLDTSQADEGHYSVTTSIDPNLMVGFVLDLDAPVRPQEGSGTIFMVPSGIAWTDVIYLPLVRR